MFARMPKEHGAWGMLLVPFASAAAVAGGATLPVVLAGACLLSLFLLRGSLEETQGFRSIFDPTNLFFEALAACCAALLLFLYHRNELVILGIVALALYDVQRRLIPHRGSLASEKRSLQSELIGALLLSLAAPVAWIAARGRLETAGTYLWLLNLLFFLGEVLYVKYRVRGLLVHRKFPSWIARVGFAWPVLLYYAGLGELIALLVFGGRVPTTVTIAFVPAVLRAATLTFQIGRGFSIRRLGWNEVAQSVTFALLLIASFRLGH